MRGYRVNPILYIVPLGVGDILAYRRTKPQPVVLLLLENRLRTGNKMTPETSGNRGFTRAWGLLYVCREVNKSRGKTPHY